MAGRCVGVACAGAFAETCAPHTPSDNSSRPDGKILANRLELTLRLAPLEMLVTSKNSTGSL